MSGSLSVQSGSTLEQGLTLTAELQERFLEHLRHEGRGRATIRRYRRTLSDLRCLPGAERLRLARKLEKVCPEDASLHDWNDALRYLAGQPPPANGPGRP